jgi:hypothetical protein
MPVIFIRIRFIIPLFIFFSGLTVSGQMISKTSPIALFDVAQQTLSDTIKKRTAVDYPFIIGREHQQVFDKASHPYLNENEWQKGSLVYNGTAYSADVLKYDIETDNLIYLLVANNSAVNVIALDENAITEFNLSNKTYRFFRNIKSERGKSIKAGYYEVVYDGKLKFLIRREKKQIISNNYIKYDNASINMYLLQDDQLTLIHNMSQLMNQLLEPYQEAVRRYKKENHLRISKSNYLAASKVLQFYEKLMEQ